MAIQKTSTRAESLPIRRSALIRENHARKFPKTTLSTSNVLQENNTTQDGQTSPDADNAATTEGNQGLENDASIPSFADVPQDTQTRQPQPKEVCHEAEQTIQDDNHQVNQASRATVPEVAVLPDPESTLLEFQNRELKRLLAETRLENNRLGGTMHLVPQKGVKTIKEFEWQVNDLKSQLAATKKQLVNTNKVLEISKKQTPKKQLATTKDQLKAAQQQLISAKQQLVITKDQLGTTKQQVVTVKHEQASTRQNVVNIKQQLASTKQQLVLSKRECSGLRFHVRGADTEEHHSTTISESSRPKLEEEETISHALIPNLTVFSPLETLGSRDNPNNDAGPEKTEKLDVLRAQKESLEFKVALLQKEQRTLRPLVDVGVAVRMRFLEQAKRFDLNDQIKQFDHVNISKGNWAAHNANIAADSALFTDRVFKFAQQSNLEQVFKQLYHCLPSDSTKIINHPPILRNTLNRYIEINHIAQYISIKNRFTDVISESTKIIVDLGDSWLKFCAEHGLGKAQSLISNSTSHQLQERRLGELIPEVLAWSKRKNNPSEPDEHDASSSTQSGSNKKRKL